MRNESITFGGDSYTQGIETEDGFVTLDSVSPSTPTTTKTANVDHHAKTPYGEVLTFTGPFLDAVESHSPTVAALFSLIGYVCIATFGEMSILGFGLYVAFLFCVFSLYKFVINKIQVKNIMKGVNRYLLISTIILSVIVILQNWTLIVSLLQEVSSYLPEKNVVQESETNEMVEDSI